MGSQPLCGSKDKNKGFLISALYICTVFPDKNTPLEHARKWPLDCISRTEYSAARGRKLLIIRGDLTTKHQS